MDWLKKGFRLYLRSFETCIWLWQSLIILRWLCGCLNVKIQLFIVCHNDDHDYKIKLLCNNAKSRINELLMLILQKIFLHIVQPALCFFSCFVLCFIILDDQWLTVFIIPGCVHVCLRSAVDVGSSGVCMFRVLILLSILVLNCEVLWASLVGLGAV